MSRNARRFYRSGSTATDHDGRRPSLTPNRGSASIDFNPLTSDSQMNQTTPPSSGTEYWSPGQSIPMMTPPNFQQIGQSNQVDYQPMSMTPHTYNNLHSTPHAQRAIAAPTPIAPTPGLTEILESQKRLETLVVSLLERLESLENYQASTSSRSSFSSASGSSGRDDELKKRVPPELSVSDSYYNM